MTRTYACRSMTGPWHTDLHLLIQHIFQFQSTKKQNISSAHIPRTYLVHMYVEITKQIKTDITNKFWKNTNVPPTNLLTLQQVRSELQGDKLTHRDGYEQQHLIAGREDWGKAEEAAPIAAARQEEASGHLRGVGAPVHCIRASSAACTSPVLGIDRRWIRGCRTGH